MGLRRDNDFAMTSAPGGWIGVLAAVLKTSGPAAVIAILLVLYLTGDQSKKLDAIVGTQNTIMGKLSSAQIEMTKFAATHMEEDRTKNALLASQIALLRQLCVNTAKTPEQTRGCLVER